MPSKDMETFKVKDRLLLMGVLPKAGDISTIRIISELMEKLGFSEAEHKKFKIKSNEGGGVKWDDKLDKGVEIAFGKKAREIVVTALKEMSDKKKLGVEFLPLYDRFVTAEEDDESS